MKRLGTVGRYAVLLGCLVALQSAVMSHLTLVGTLVELAIPLTVVTGFHGGPDRGAITGFVAGAAIDLIVHTPFGMTMLVLSVVGYAAGRAGEFVLRSNRFIRACAAAVGVAVAVGLFGLITWLLDLQFVTRVGAIRIAIINAGFAMAVNPLTERAVRWGLRLKQRAGSVDAGRVLLARRLNALRSSRTL